MEVSLGNLVWRVYLLQAPGLRGSSLPLELAEHLSFLGGWIYPSTTGCQRLASCRPQDWKLLCPRAVTSSRYGFFPCYEDRKVTVAAFDFFNVVYFQ